MRFEWLNIRISEEKDRRERENAVLARLEEVFQDLRSHLADCVETYNQAFAGAPARLEDVAGPVRTIRLSANDLKVEMSMDHTVPGFHIDQPSGRTSIVTGVLPGGNMFYRDANKYLSLEEVTKKVLDETLFPKLKD